MKSQKQRWTTRHAAACLMFWGPPLLVLVFDPIEAAGRALLHLLEPRRRHRLCLLCSALPPAAAAALLILPRRRLRRPAVVAVVPLVGPRRPERAVPLHGSIWNLEMLSKASVTCLKGNWGWRLNLFAYYIFIYLSKPWNMCLFLFEEGSPIGYENSFTAFYFTIKFVV